MLLQLKKRLLSEKRTFLEGSTEAWEAVGEHRQSVSDDEIRGVKARSLSNTGSQSLRNKKESFSNAQEKSGIFSLKSLIKAVDVSLWALLWYGFSVSLVVYNKWLLNSWQGGFKFPLIMSTSHMILKLVFAFAVSPSCFKMLCLFFVFMKCVFFSSSLLRSDKKSCQLFLEKCFCTARFLWGTIH